MPLCQYFLNGNCRFGSKCNNDHIDLKQMLKTEVDSVINGKQWLMSCFGPFKESTCIPNFISDQSFEEIRWGFMESQNAGNVQQYIANLMNEYSNAMAKLTELKMPSQEALQMIATIYNNSNENNNKSNQSGVKPSAFGSAVSSTPQNNIFGTGIFASSTTNNQPTMSSSSIFGTPAVNNNSSFQQPSSASIFGVSNEQQKSPFSFNQPKPTTFGQSDSIFGAPQVQQPQPQSNIFAQSPFSAPATMPSSSIFGAPVQQQPLQQSSSIFSSPQASVQPKSVFGSFNQSTTMQPQVPQQQSIFSGISSNIFQQPAQAQPSNSIFGQVQVQSPQQPTPSTNIFGGSMLQAPATSQLPPSQNIFAIQQQPQNIPEVTSGSIFATQQQIQNPTSFGSNPFQQNYAPVISESAYSRLEDLTQEEIHAFQAEEFTLGKIPMKPPPINLIN